jgi:molybdate transport system substrate-binding protein
VRGAALAVVALALAGCGGGAEDDLTVFAASSLADVAPAVDPKAAVALGGSNDLAAQIRDGADADVFLSASAGPVTALREAGLVEAPFVFASNRLVLVVPAANPGRIGGLADVARPGVKLVLGATGVPVGDYAREALAAAGLDDVEVVSLEDDVKGVLGKVALGEADAGIVYATDARAAGEDVRTVQIADELQPEVRYYATLVSPASSEGRAYLDRLLGAEGVEALRAAGFLPVPS